MIIYRSRHGLELFKDIPKKWLVRTFVEIGNVVIEAGAVESVKVQPVPVGDLQYV